MSGCQTSHYSSYFTARYCYFYFTFATALDSGTPVPVCTNGEYIVVSEGLLQKVNLTGDDIQRIQSYQMDLHFHPICNVDKTCKALLDGSGHLWLPSTGRIQYHQIKDAGLESSTKLHGEDCFNFVSITSLVIGALCLHTTAEEVLVVPHKIVYVNNHHDVRDNHLGIELHINVSDHSPFIILQDDSGPVVLYITYRWYGEDLPPYSLVIIRFSFENYDVISVPSECTGPHDLQPVGNRDGIVRCSNGIVLYYNGDNPMLMPLPYGSIEAIASCSNLTSLVLVQDAQRILFKDSSTDDTNDENGIYGISLNTSGLVPPPNVISSPVCFASQDGNNIDFYFTSEHNNTVYQVSVLDNVVKAEIKDSNIPKVFKRLSSQNNLPIKLFIDEVSLWGKQGTSIFISNLVTKKNAKISISSPVVFVLQYTAAHCEIPIIKVHPPNNEERVSTRRSHGTIIISILVSTVALLVVTAVIVFITIYFIRCRQDRSGTGMVQSGVSIYHVPA